MKTIITTLGAIALLGNITLADDFDDQLDLQNKTSGVQNQSSNKDDILLLDNEPKNIKNLIHKNDKNGGFIGVEGVLGSGDMNFNVTNIRTYPIVSVSKTVVAFDRSVFNTTFDLGLVGGYQHYFGDSQRHGIKVSAHFYSGFGDDFILKNDKDIHDVSSDGNYSS